MPVGDLYALSYGCSSTAAQVIVTCLDQAKS
jgi:hypothetical protein